MLLFKILKRTGCPSVYMKPGLRDWLLNPSTTLYMKTVVLNWNTGRAKGQKKGHEVHVEAMIEPLTLPAFACTMATTLCHCNTMPHLQQLVTPKRNSYLCRRHREPPINERYNFLPGV